VIYIGGYLNVRPITICNTLIAKYNYAGELIWSVIYDTSVYATNRGLKMMCDKQNNIIIGIEAVDTSLIYHIAVFKYSSEGKLIWNKYFAGSQYDDELYGMNMDNNDNIYMLSASCSNNEGGCGYCTVKYDSSGNKLWERRYAITSSDIPESIYVDSLCNSYVTGSWASLKYDSSGNLLWSIRNNVWTNEYDNTGKVIKLDRYNDIFILGDGCSSSTNSCDILVVKYSQITSGIINHNKIVYNYKLEQNYPNPFNPVTNIKYQIAKNSSVTLKVFDILGREIETLINEKQNTGTYEIKFNGSKLASGMYFYSLFINGNRFDTKKLILLK
jgi:hypothetical protein